MNTVDSDFEKVVESVNQAESKVTYNKATIDSEIKKLREMGFNSDDPVAEADKWLDENETKLDDLEKEIVSKKAEIISEHNKIIRETTVKQE